MKNYFRLKFLTCLLLLTVSLSAKAGKEEFNDRELKVLTIATSAELTTLYPLNMDVQNLVGTRLCYEQLVEYVDGVVKPWLASSWSFTDNGRTLTFNLRTDVTFHDETVFNAEAVKTEFEYTRKNPNFTSIVAVQNIESIAVIDEFTVAFSFSKPYFGNLTEFGFREVMVCVSPEVIEEGNFQNMKGVVGTGPYIYSEVKSGEFVRFIKNDKYWGEEPVFDEIIVKYIPENSARLLALRKGEVDLIYGNSMISWDDFNQAINYKNIKGIVSPVVTRTSSVVVNAGNPVLGDIRVREAISYGIDKESICKGLTYGNDVVADTLFPPGNKYTDVKLDPVRRFDTEKSIQLLNDAEWIINDETGFREKDGIILRFKLTYDSGETMNKMISTIIKSQLAFIGIDVYTEGQDMMTWWKEGVSGNYGMILWATEENTAPQKYFMNFPTSSPHTPSMAALDDSSEFMDMVKEIQGIDDTERVKEIFNFFLTYNNDNVIDIPLRFLKESILFNTENISDYIFSSTPMMFEIDNLRTN